MRYDAAVVTANYDGYDTVKPVLPQAGITVDWVLVTDDPKLPGDYLGWRTVYELWPGMHPNRAAKQAKIRPSAYTTAPASVWVDASYRVTSDRFVEQALACADPIAQFSHPWRDCLYDEASASLELPKYAGQPLREQAQAYRDAGHPEHWGLWAAGVIARRHTPQVARFEELWAEQVDRWSFQDQVAQPYALRAAGLRPSSFPYAYEDSFRSVGRTAWLHYEGSARH